VLTATGDLSHNRKVGLALAQARPWPKRSPRWVM
jgi:glycerol-3-phosphate dehydrogenase